MKDFLKLACVLILFFSFLSITKTYEAINRSDILEKYIKEQIQTINTLAKKYDIENEKIIRNNIKKAKEYLSIVKKLKNSNLEKEKREKVIHYIFTGLKNLKNDIVPVLKEKKLLFDTKLKQKKEQYIILAHRLEKWIYKLNKVLKKYMKGNNKKAILSKYIEGLEIESENLKTFKNISFETQEHMDKYFKDILFHIQLDLQNIKKIIQSQEL